MDKCQEALNELKDLVHSELDGTKTLNKHLVYCNTLQDLIDQNKTLTLEECIKEWEEKGFEVENNDKSIFFRNTKLNTDIYIDKVSKDIQICVCHYNYAQTISFDLHNLLTKTIKALEVENG